MGKFVFKLQSLLNIKANMEDNVKNELGKAVQQLEKEKEALATIENGKNRCVDEFNLKTNGKFMPMDLKEYSQYISYLNQKALQQKENIKSARKNVDKVREELLEVMKERQVLEKLKEKRYRRFLEEEKKQEQKMIDEIVNYKHSTLKKI